MPAASPVSNTSLGIIQDAMVDAGLLQTGDIPDSQTLSDNFRRLCDIINLEQTQGLKLYLSQDIEITLIENQTLYVVGPGGDVDMPKPLQVLQGFVLIAQDETRRPVYPLSWDDWMRLSQVTGNSSTVTSYFVDKQPTLFNINVWNAPDATEAANTLHLLMRTQTSMPSNLYDESGFPQEWRIFLRWALAEDISTGQPQAIMDRCSRMAEKYRTLLEDFDVEDAPTMFAVDSRYFTGSSYA